MITFLSKKHVRYAENGADVVIAYIAVGNVSELPTKTSIPDIVLHEASRAWDIASGKTYGFIDNGSDGVWNEQTTVINPMVLKGRVNTVNDLPANPEVGWVYMVGLSTDTAFQEYMYTADQRWEFIGYNAITIDSAMSTTSENPVQNKVIAEALTGKVDTVAGKGLSTEDYTTTDKASVAASASVLTPISESAYEALVTKDKPLYFIYDDSV